MIRILSIFVRSFKSFFSSVPYCSSLIFTRSCKNTKSHRLRRAAVNSKHLTSKYFRMRCTDKFSFAPTFSKLEVHFAGAWKMLQFYRQWRSQPDIWSANANSVYRPYKDSSFKEMNSDNDLKLAKHDQIVRVASLLIPGSFFTK